VKKVVKYLYDQYKDEIMGEINLNIGEAGGQAVANSMIDLDSESIEDQAEDELYERAREMVIASGGAATSYLQRKLGVGYARAAKLIDMMEERGVVGPKNGSKPREILVAGGGNDEGGESDAGEENI
jgi:DNA segregation ATPase FtsK/SpoIIIE-like protein